MTAHRKIISVTLVDHRLCTGRLLLAVLILAQFATYVSTLGDYEWIKLAVQRSQDKNEIRVAIKHGELDYARSRIAVENAIAVDVLLYLHEEIWFFFAAVMSATIAISVPKQACSKTRMVWWKNTVALIAYSLPNDLWSVEKYCNIVFY